MIKMCSAAMRFWSCFPLRVRKQRPGVLLNYGLSCKSIEERNSAATMPRLWALIKAKKLVFAN